MSKAEITPELLTELVETASQAPSGPWRVNDTHRDLVWQHGSHATIAACGGTPPYSHASARFIALANPETVLALVQCIRELEEYLGEAYEREHSEDEVRHAR